MEEATYSNEKPKTKENVFFNIRERAISQGHRPLC
jgi:hypothetical protein